MYFVVHDMGLFLPFHLFQLVTSIVQFYGKIFPEETDSFECCQCKTVKMLEILAYKNNLE